MAPVQEAEIIFAQKLASNEKPIRSKALVKLRKYISARSARAEGGFSEEELLKIWKGLFYCQWMQDKPLLQEELSTKISRLLHSFRTVDSQFLYFKTFLQTMKREWNGIDILRMDKFYQLVRFVFREVFEMLKRQEWESSLVSEFLQLISAQLLQSSSAAPTGFVLHILDLYMTELALVGSAELTADQNQTFIEPFFKTMAKTKDRVLLKAIGSNIFNTIVDQVPYAIEDLKREIRQNAGEELDSCEESENNQDNEEKTQDCAENRDENEDWFLDDTDTKDDDTCGPVLQFDYGAIADRLFALASNSKIQSFNRSKIYKFVKIFRDLSEGVFPQDEVENVSSDDTDDDEDQKRKRKRRKRQKNKERKESSSLDKSNGQSESAAASDDTDISKEKKKSKKKRKNKSLKSVDGQTDPSEETQDADVEGAATDLTEKMESNAELSEGDSERTHVNSSTEPADKQPKAFKLLKRKRRKKTVSRKTSEDTSEGANDSSEMEISVESAEIVTSVPLKKKQKLKKKAKEIGEGETGRESELTSACLTSCISATTPVDVSTATPSKKRLKKPSSDKMTEAEVKEQCDSQKTVDTSDSSKASRKTTMKKKKKQKDVVPEPDANGEVDDLQTETGQRPAGRMGMKKSKQKSAAEQITPARKRRVKEEEVKPSQVNGHTDETSVKRPKIISEEPSVTKNKKAKEFVLRQKKAPAPIFCKAAGMSTRMASKKDLCQPSRDLVIPPSVEALGECCLAA
ncbi:ribosomal RNA processing 1 -like protein [Labeo rohita]|uniref:Ribosomal RNA processing 1-like protein n=1 Tax=Labeo rohita TaxID=84645 RepID=A0A498ML31_LABRO|nr:ribosomal RNA processing 1 -like protein [Labeo rohita]